LNPETQKSQNSQNTPKGKRVKVQAIKRRNPIKNEQVPNLGMWFYSKMSKNGVVILDLMKT